MPHARFFAFSWKSPQVVDQRYSDRLYHQYKRELELLLISLPDRFRPLIQRSISYLPSIFSLPIVLLHKVCNMAGVVDWAEAEFAPFGLNLHSHQRLISKVHIRAGWIR